MREARFINRTRRSPQTAAEPFPFLSPWPRGPLRVSSPWTCGWALGHLSPDALPQQLETRPKCRVQLRARLTSEEGGEHCVVSFQEARKAIFLCGETGPRPQVCTRAGRRRTAPEPRWR